MYKLDDDIVALATIPGKSALNVIRVSGGLTKRLFAKITKKTGAPNPNYSALEYLYAHKETKPFDQAMVVYYKGPKSFTGEDCLEFSVHGGPLIANKLIDALIKYGARQALPGEFSYRAFINNKIDLLQAEAIASIVQANNVIDSYYYLNSIKGSLSKDLKACKKDLQTVLMIGEKELDFTEEEIEHTTKDATIKRLEKNLKKISTIKKKSYMQESEESNIRVAIIGKPNAGKSSLFNILLGRSRAIVTEEKGTTRDTIEVGVYIGTTPVVLVDTAGIREGKSKAEAIGVKKTYHEIKKASILIVIDETNPKEVIQNIQINNKKTLFVQNKLDIKKKSSQKNVLHISCKEKTGISNLLTRLSTCVKKDYSSFTEQYSFLINQRQKQLLNKIEGGIIESISAYKKTGDFTVCISCLYGVLRFFDELIKPNNKNELLNKIFMGFCIGK